jgi:uncharacterized glyoxalase superfamily protein PhnB
MANQATRHRRGAAVGQPGSRRRKTSDPLSRHRRHASSSGTASRARAEVGNAHTSGGGLRFALDTEESIRSFDPAWSAPSGGHRTTIAFLCDSPDDVDRLYEELVRAGAPSYKAPWDAFWGQRYAQVRDPDCNTVDLVALSTAPHDGAAPIRLQRRRSAESGPVLPPQQQRREPRATRSPPGGSAPPLSTTSWSSRLVPASCAIAVPAASVAKALAGRPERQSRWRGKRRGRGGRRNKRPATLPARSPRPAACAVPAASAAPGRAARAAPSRRGSRRAGRVARADGCCRSARG